MKKLDWLTPFIWPFLMVVIWLALLAGVFLWPDKNPPPTPPFAVAGDVKYTLRNSQEPIASEEIAEIRALYASDLFASSRGNHLPAAQAVTNRSDLKDIIPSENPLFLSFPQTLNKTGGVLSAETLRKADDQEVDPDFRPHSLKPPSRPAKKNTGNTADRHPQVAIELTGDLKCFSIDPAIFQDIAQSAERKPWSVQAEARINSAGRIEHILAESTDCAPALYQEIIRRLYQYRFANVTQACEGTIAINYPVYTAKQPGKH